ncbi:hypothetical protein B0E47_08265 [Rhodanobacter sp. B05]|uniref:hypothetical protein n=1 Tax=Rhodanobacter sp. B05 TaxID=1945859 RepID=UPI0009844EFC|nr:hypothetical protein [Rhodanobacter sp. B05]OOG55844.1 hypothetical protein B0E47_08265 [Rhodanobacter sp. B05]
MIGTTKFMCLLIVLIVLPMGVSACRHTPDEEQVRQVIAAVSRGAESASAGDVVAPLSKDFDGNAGELDRRSLGNMVRLVALRGEHIGVTMGPVTIEHRGARIVATFTVGLSSGSGGLLPGRLGVYQVESAWRHEDGEWLCYSASWKRAISSSDD